MSDTKSAEEKKEERDFYNILGVERTANESQIKHAYRKLAIRYHPDKNPGDKEAAEKFNEISMAYAVLSDPKKKRLYDIKGEECAIQSLNVAELNHIGRFLGAVASRAGISLPTEIVPQVLDIANSIQNGKHSGRTPKDVVYDKTISGSIERLNADFYYINMSVEDLKKGVIIHTLSNKGDKFKVAFFDKDGTLTTVEESQETNKISEASLFFVPFQRYQLIRSGLIATINATSRTGEEIPPVFMSLDSFEKDIRAIAPGKHLFCVYGDNWFHAANYTLRCVVDVEQHDNVKKIQEIEAQLSKKKTELISLYPDYVAAKKKFEEVSTQVKDNGTEVQELITDRDKAYSEYYKTNKASCFENKDPDQTFNFFSNLNPFSRSK